jgi:glycosyltransferase involved in cell wall biosynthesis
VRVLVAIPAYNEAATVADVVREVREYRPDDMIMVVDDGSGDDTAERAAGQSATVVRLPFNTGVGAAMRTAFLYASRNSFDAVVQVDADGQHDPAGIKALLDGLQNAAVVVGARGDSLTVRGPRRWAMVLLARSLSRIVGTRLTDVTSGFRAADRRAIDLYARSYPSEYLGDTVESLVVAARAGLPVAQVDVEMRPRQGGRRSQGPFMSAAYLSRALLALVVAVSRRSEVLE